MLLVEGCVRSDCGRDGAPECAICLDRLGGGAGVSQLPCGHAYHCACIERWLLAGRETCPVCRASVWGAQLAPGAPPAVSAPPQTPAPLRAANAPSLTWIGYAARVPLPLDVDPDDMQDVLEFDRLIAACGAVAGVTLLLTVVSALLSTQTQ